MKIQIVRISKKSVLTKKGPANKISVQDQNGTWYSCFYHPMTDAWKQGDVIDVEVKQNGDFWNIITPKTTSQRPYTPQATEMNEAIKSQLERIERKLDKLLEYTRVYEPTATYNPSSPSSKITKGELVSAKLTLPNDIPYADSPPPTDEDQTY